MATKQCLHFLVVVWILLVPIKARAENELADKVHAFAQKVAASQEQASKPPTGDEKDPAALARRDYEQRERQESGRRFTTQSKLLEAALRRDDFEAALQLTRDAGNYPLRADLTEQWSDLLVGVVDGVEKQSKEAQEKWYATVNELVKEAHDTCLAATHSTDLDSLLLRVAATQMRRSRRDTILSQRGDEKLSGVTLTLQNWARYLDHRDAGNVKTANEVLRSFGANASQFPVLAAGELKSKWLSVGTENSLAENAKIILGDLKMPDDLPGVLDRWKKLLQDPQLSPTGNSYDNSVTARLETMQKAFAALQLGDDQTALRFLNSTSFEGGQPDLVPYFTSLKNKLFDSVVAARVKSVAGLEPDRERGWAELLQRAMERLQDKGDYNGVLELQKVQESLDRRPGNAESTSIQHFLAAQRFEAAGDILSAIIEYRTVVATPTGKFIPQKEASDGLKRLQERNPEAFKGYEGAVLQELRNLRQQLQILPNRFPPGRSN
jgi:hypothetical protein